MLFMVDNFLTRFAVGSDSSFTGWAKMKVPNRLSCLATRTPTRVLCFVNFMATIAKFFLVDTHMRTFGVSLKVLWAVIQLISVDMMGNFFWQKWSPKFFLKNNSSRWGRFSIEVNPTTTFIYPTLWSRRILDRVFTSLPASVMFLAPVPSNYSTETIFYLACWHNWNGTMQPIGSQ